MPKKNIIVDEDFPKMEDLMWTIKWRFRYHNEVSTKQCPKFASCNPDYDYFTCMQDLIRYRDEIQTLPEPASVDDLYSFLKDRLSIQWAGSSFKFNEVIEKFYSTHPELVPMSTNKFAMIEKRLELVEQFQAQILDKLTVFTDMLNELQINALKVTK